MITASAPGKLILFGEHAVVYGEAAIATAIDKRTTVTACEIDERKIIVESAAWSESKECGLNDPATEPIIQAAQSAMQHAKKKIGIALEVKSDIPLASGMGSSAAISSASAAAVLQLLTNEAPTLEIAEIAYDGEKIAHGKPSGLDTAVTSFGKTIFFQQGKIEPISTPDFSLVVGDTGIRQSTKLQIEKVKKYIEDPMMGHSLYSIGGLVKTAKNEIQNKNVSAIGQLMNKNHEFLRKLGVSSPELENLVKTAREAGALGAKLTGAGGGGCMIALTDRPDEIIKALQEEGVKAFQVKTNQEGVRIDHDTES